VRAGLFGGVLVGMLLVAVAMVRYPGSGPMSGQYLAEGIIALLILAGLAGWLARWGIPASARDAFGSARLGMSAGLVMGVLWVLEICFNNLVPRTIATESARFVVQNGVWAIIALGMVAVGVAQARRVGRIDAGIVVGFWSGLVSGLVSCVMGLLVVVAWLDKVLTDSFSIQEWAERGPTSGAPDMATYFAYQTMGGGILHLLVLGIAMGALLGVIGGIVGRALAASPRSHSQVTG
jgi:hypothetical protein